MKTAIGYTRVSTSDQANSLALQREEIERWCEHECYELEAVLVDEAVSGGKPLQRRPQGCLIYAALNAKPVAIDAIVFSRLDRAGRSVLDILQLVEIAFKRDVRLVFIHDNLDAGTPYGKTMLQMVAAFAELERSLIRERITAGVGRRKAEGQVYSRHAPYGKRRSGRYVIEGHRRVQLLEDDPSEQAIVARIYALFDEGAPMCAISRRLNDEGVPTRGGGPWYPSTIASVLRASIR